MINSLKSKEYIDTELIYKENTKQVEMRKLIPIKNKYTYLRKGASRASYERQN